MNTRAVRRASIVGVLVSGWMLGMAPPRQGERGDPPPRGANAGESREVSEARARDRLTRMRDRIDEALKQLDEGTPAREVVHGILRDHERLARAVDPDRGSPRRASSNDEPMTAEQAKALVAEHLPDLHERLVDPEASMPGVRSMALERIANRVRHVLAESENDPELRTLMLDELRTGAAVFDAVRRLREARRQGENATAEAAAHLEAAIGAQFDARHAVAQAELARLEQRVSRMRADVERMSDRRDTEIGRMLERVRHAPERREGQRRERRDP